MRPLLTIIVLMLAWCVRANALAADCSAEEPQEKKRYTSVDVNLRYCPNTYCPVYATLPKGQVVFAFSEEGEWSRVNVRALNVVGYVASRYLVENCQSGAEVTRQSLPEPNVVTILLSRSQMGYSGSCPCPNNVDRAGRRCGARSAYSRPGGASPLCYPSDVTEAMIAGFRADRKF